MQNELNRLHQKYGEEFVAIAAPVITHDLYQTMREIPHHHESVYEHCLDVAYFAYRIARKRHWDYESTIRGALLHDFYLYKFKRKALYRLVYDAMKHAAMHPRLSLKNALEHFQLNEMEQDIIKKHMFPFGIPRYRESWTVSLVDKGLAILEYAQRLTRGKVQWLYFYQKPLALGQ